MSCRHGASSSWEGARGPRSGGLACKISPGSCGSAPTRPTRTVAATSLARSQSRWFQTAFGLCQSLRVPSNWTSWATELLRGFCDSTTPPSALGPWESVLALSLVRAKKTRAFMVGAHIKTATGALGIGLFKTLHALKKDVSLKLSVQSNVKVITSECQFLLTAHQSCRQLLVPRSLQTSRDVRRNAQQHHGNQLLSNTSARGNSRIR